MALKLSVDSLDGLDDNIKGLYVEKEGKFVLPVDGIEDTSGLKSALQKERKTAADLEKQTRAWKSFGKTPEEIQTLLDEQERKERSEAERRGEFDKILAQVNEKNKSLLDAERSANEALKTKYKSKIIDREAVSAIAAAKGSPELLLPVVQKFIRVDENDNVIVVDSKGDPRVNDKGGSLTLAELVNEMRSSDIYGRAFDGSGQSGSGMPPSNGTSGGTGGRITKADLEGKDAVSRKARAAFINANGAEAYFKLPSK